MKRFFQIHGLLPAARFLPLMALLLMMAGSATAAEAPRPGGELVFAVGETPPSFDGHRETTFGMLHPVAPHYSTSAAFRSAELSEDRRRRR